MSDSLGELMDRYNSVYTEVEENFMFWKPYMVEEHMKAVVDYIAGTLVFGYRSGPEFMLIVSPMMSNSLAFSGKVKGYLPDLHVVTSREPVDNQAFIYIHNEKMRREGSFKCTDVTCESAFLN